jgi:hypothetical protein
MLHTLVSNERESGSVIFHRNEVVDVCADGKSRKYRRLRLVYRFVVHFITPTHRPVFNSHLLNVYILLSVGCIVEMMSIV